MSENIKNSSSSQGLLGLHVFTGIDSVSAFVGKGKKRPFDTFMKHEKFQQVFQCLGVEFSISSAVVEALEQFVCLLYGQSCNEINEARYRLFCTKALSEVRLPPCQDALLLHCKRANYQAAIWRRALLNVINAPSPEEHGWIINGSEVSIRWMTQGQGPPELMKYYSCKCVKSKCKSNHCSCFMSGISCTEMCSCIGCQNDEETVVEFQLVNDVSDDDDDESEI